MHFSEQNLLILRASKKRLQKNASYASGAKTSRVVIKKIKSAIEFFYVNELIINDEKTNFMLSEEQIMAKNKNYEVLVKSREN